MKMRKRRTDKENFGTFIIFSSEKKRLTQKPIVMRGSMYAPRPKSPFIKVPIACPNMPPEENITPRRTIVLKKMAIIDIT